MDFNAFELIRDKISGELVKQEFTGPIPLDGEPGRAEMYKTDDVAYGLFYNDGKFELRCAALDADGAPADWRSLSLWLFDESSGTKSDAISIASDFESVISGPTRTAAIVQQKKKRSKGDERSVDPQFFFNRLVSIFPELKDEMNQEKIIYGQIRSLLFAKSKVAPLCRELAKHRPNSSDVEKLCSVFDDMYQNGDADLRAILTIGILNELDAQSFEVFQNKFGADLKKISPYTRKLIGKKIKPEKRKKEKKVMATLNDR